MTHVLRRRPCRVSLRTPSQVTNNFLAPKNCLSKISSLAPQSSIVNCNFTMTRALIIVLAIIWRSLSRKLMMKGWGTRIKRTERLWSSVWIRELWSLLKSGATIKGSINFMAASVQARKLMFIWHRVLAILQLWSSFPREHLPETTPSKCLKHQFWFSRTERGTWQASTGSGTATVKEIHVRWSNCGPRKKSEIWSVSRSAKLSNALCLTFSRTMWSWWTLSGRMELLPPDSKTPR